MRSKKPCKCIKNFINGTKLLNVLKRKDTQMSKILRKITTIGFSRLNKSKKQQKLKNKREITIKLSLCI